MSIFILLLALALWGTLHSILASNFAKDMLGGSSFYRLGYNIFAGISFLPILYWMRTLPDQLIYTVPIPWNILMYAGQLLAAFLLVISLLQTDVLSFIGLQQLFEEEHTSSLVTRGFYRYVRHPLYTFSLLFIWLAPTMTQNSFAVYFGATIYVLVGVIFEERKLLREFREAYAMYKQNTPMLIPGLVFGKK